MSTSPPFLADIDPEPPPPPPPMKNTQFLKFFCHTLLHRSYIPNFVNLGQILRIFTFRGSKKFFLKVSKIIKMVKNNFFQKSKKMPLRTPEEVLHAKFQTYSSKTVACGGGTDTMRIFTFRGSKKFF